MTTGNADPSQGENGGANEPPASPPPPAHSLSGGNKVYKSGPLYLSSKGIGWTSWKKRWFILTRTSLVFFRSDPNVVPQKGSEVNLTLGGIDLNSSGSVVVKEDKKLLTVLFPDGRDGRAFTLKAETMEDLHEWKVALEEALANAPVAVAVGQNSILRNDQPNAADISSEQLKDRQSAKSLVIGRPILLALEDIDGTPSFLEKALRFLEEYGVKIEGILRQAADVDDVEHRIREYENGKTEFSAEEDPHVIADCIKYVLRELPSSPVPASCCKALLEAFRTDRGVRVNAMRSAICETFPEPNRRLLQRILMMMQTVASHKAVNRMSISAVAACMAPLLLRPLLAGDCELENDFDVGGDGSVQLLQAAAAANHAQAIVITLLEDYEKIFGEGSGTPEPYTDSEESGSESDEITDDDDYDDGDSFEDDDEATEDDYDVDVDEDSEHEPSATSSETDENEHSQKVSRSCSSGSESPQAHDVLERRQNLTSSEPQSSLLSHDNIQGNDNTRSHSIDNAKKEINASLELLGTEHAEIPIFQEAPKLSPAPEASKSSPGHVRSARRPTVWGRTPAKKNLSMESIDLNFDDEAEIQNLESVKEDLQKRIEAETKTNSLLLDGLQKRKHDLHEHRLALEKDVARLQEQLQKQIELRSLLEGGHRISQMPQSISAIVDEKVKTDLEEITQAEAGVWNLKQKTNNLQLQLNQQHEQNPRIAHDTAGKPLPSPNRHRKSKEKLVDGRVTSTSSTSENVSRSQHEPYLDKTSSGKDKKQESSSLNKSLPPNQQTDAAQNSKDTAVCTSSTTMEMGTNKSSTPGSKKSSSRGEGSNSTSSALSKLTNRLNFLKERRSQIASELQNLDKGHNSSPPVQNLERGGGSEQNMDKSQQPKGQSLEKSRELENSELPNYPNSAGKDRNSEGNPNLDRGKSESFPVAEKGRSKIPPRTFSR